MLNVQKSEPGSPRIQNAGFTVQDLELPAYLQIEPSGACNLSCPMCAAPVRPDKPPRGPAFMAFSTFMSILDQFPGVRQLHLQGLGEPLLNPAFFDMVGYAAERGIQVSASTNLTVFDRTTASRLVSSGLSCLHVSVDGATSASYESIRGRPFLRLLQNLRLLKRERSGRRAPRLHLTVVAMRRNLAELPQLVRLAYDHGLDQVFVQHLSHSFAEPSLGPAYRRLREFAARESLAGEEPEAVASWFGKARQTGEELGVDVRLPNRAALFDPTRPAGCEWPFTAAYITYAGEVIPCCMAATPDRVTFGNVIATPFPDIWRGEAYDGFRKALVSPDPPEICRGCSLFRGAF